MRTNASETKKVLEKQTEIDQRTKTKTKSFFDLDMTDLRRTIIILMALACVITVIGVIHCHVNHPYVTDWYSYRTSYSIIFPICKSLSINLMLTLFSNFVDFFILFSVHVNRFYSD